jgi:hypothetical protein
VANSTELTAVAANVLGMPLISVVNSMRYLREAGMVSKSGRGTSAAQMTVEDTVILLASLTGSEQIKNSAEVANKVLSLRAGPATVRALSRMQPRFGERLPPNDRPQKLLALEEAHTFKDVLIRLFEITADEADETKNLWHPRLFRDRDMDRAIAAPEIRVRVFYPRFSASIEVRIPKYWIESRVYGRGPNATARMMSNEFPRDRSGDLVSVHEFSERTIQKLSRLLMIS